MSTERPTVDHRTAGIMAVSITTVAWALVPLVLKQIHMPTLAFAAYRLMMGALVYAVVLAAANFLSAVVWLLVNRKRFAVSTRSWFASCGRCSN